MKSIQDQYKELFTPQELSEIETYSLKILKKRQNWSIHDACHSWLEGVIFMMLKKGLLRSLVNIKLDEKKDA